MHLTPKKLNKYYLRGKEVKQFLAEASKKINIDMQTFFGSKPNIQVIEGAETKIFVLDGKPVLASVEDRIFPTLLFKEAFRFFPKVIVDMGAVPHICSGADVMAPGIVRVEGEFDKGDVTLIVDMQHEKPIAVGLAPFNSHEIKNRKHGKAVKNIHYVGDKLWKLIKKISSK